MFLLTSYTQKTLISLEVKGIKIKRSPLYKIHLQQKPLCKIPGQFRIHILPLLVCLFSFSEIVEIRLIHCTYAHETGSFIS